VAIHRYVAPTLAPPTTPNCDSSRKRKEKVFSHGFLGRLRLRGRRLRQGQDTGTPRWAHGDRVGDNPKRRDHEGWAGINLESHRRGLPPPDERRENYSVRPDCGTRPGEALYPGLCERGTHPRLSPDREPVCLHPDGRLQGGRARKGNRSGCETLLTPRTRNDQPEWVSSQSPTGHTGSAQRPGQPYTSSVSGGRGWGRDATSWDPASLQGA